MFPAQNGSTHILITGGAGFIGANLAAHLLATTEARITIFDNLSRAGGEQNLAWLRSQARAGRLRFLRGDVRSSIRVAEAVRGVDEIYHLASCCEGPPHEDRDFEVNANGTLHVLEAARGSHRRPIVFYLSTSKVYNAIGSDQLRRDGERYMPVMPGFRGISERTPANFQSPYVCSRGVADRHVVDYARFYNLPAVVLRADTIAGPRQFENEGHGWVSHLVYSALARIPVTVYGDGMQVCDMLHVSDVVSAITAARDFSPLTSGNAYNLGGGTSHTVSVNEMISLIERICHCSVSVRYALPRPSDRPFYMADCSAFIGDTGWRPRRSLEQTVRDIAAFWNANQMHAMKAAAPARAIGGYRNAA